MILQKSFWFADLLSLLETAVLLNILLEPVMYFLGFFDE